MREVIIDCSSEIRLLAHLLRVGADVARDIAAMRRRDQAEIDDIARRTEDAADDLEKLIGMRLPGPGGRC